MAPETAQAIQAISSICQIVIAMVGVALIYWQLKKMTEANQTAAKASELASAMAVVQLELHIAEARAELAHIAAEIVSNKDNEKYDVDLGAKKMNERIEQFLNFADRLCSYIRRGHIDEAKYREDYRMFLNDIVSQYKDKFGADSRHRNIIHVHSRWADGKSAIG